MPTNIVVPEMGESVRTGVVSRWHKPDGAPVQRDEVVMDLETDKITAEIAAPAAGTLRHGAAQGQTVEVGAVVGLIEESSGAPAGAQPAPANGQPQAPEHHDDARATPLARKLASEHRVDLAAISGTGPGGRVREQDVQAHVAARQAAAAAPAAAASVATAPAPAAPMAAPAVASTAPATSHAPSQAPAAPPRPHTPQPSQGTRRERLSPLRARIAERLVMAQHNAAMLTTFNEVDMSAVMALRGRFKEDFEKRHGVGLGFMSFFVTAAAQALARFPTVNAALVQGPDGAPEVEHHGSAHVAVAVSTPKGLTVPVLRHADTLSFAQIEAGIKDLALRARDGKLTLDDLQGGTFTITNGGIFGSLMSTPILNPPQTAILGMHAIKNRPVENPDAPGQIALRPMMYLALSYDHRLLDGAEAVQFLVAVKNAVEHPERMLLGV
ncbi:MAG: dihydrolipoyllysine-residue succinyltransferase [Planctomyces sp.]|nr:dihydrolipoyllysine-residue succinyltransferase [Planctomyces sp.]